MAEAAKIGGFMKTVESPKIQKSEMTRITVVDENKKKGAVAIRLIKNK